MNNFVIKPLVSSNQFNIANDSQNSHINNINQVLKEHSLPEHPLTDNEIKTLLYLLSSMDSNNDTDRVGLGEREGRVQSSLVYDRSQGFIHGIGRSGDLTAEQPKAPGSSQLYKLTTKMLKNLLNQRIRAVNHLLIMPQATGCSLQSVYMNLKLKQPNRKQILWLRIDQKSCIKSMNIPGVVVEVIEPVIVQESKSDNKDEEFDKKIYQPFIKAQCGCDDVGDEESSEESVQEDIDDLFMDPGSRGKTKNKKGKKGGHKHNNHKKHVHNDKCDHDHDNSHHDHLHQDDKPTKNQKDYTFKPNTIHHLDSYLDNIYSLESNIDLINSKIAQQGKDNILCISVTTSCFAPRQPDKVVPISIICKQNDIPLVVNNAQGIQSNQMCSQINSAILEGRVDAVVSSLDKNFMVPVGASIIQSGQDYIISNVDKNQPGRASISGIMDVFITMCKLGRQGYEKLVKKRYDNLEYFIKNMFNYQLINIDSNQSDKQCNLSNKLKFINFNKKNEFSFDKEGCLKFLKLKGNDISLCLKIDIEKPEDLAGKLWQRRITGSKVFNIFNLKTYKSDQLELKNFGTNTNNPNINQMTAAISLGLEIEEIDLFFKKLESINSN